MKELIWCVYHEDDDENHVFRTTDEMTAYRYANRLNGRRGSKYIVRLDLCAQLNLPLTVH